MRQASNARHLIAAFSAPGSYNAGRGCLLGLDWSLRGERRHSPLPEAGSRRRRCFGRRAIKRGWDTLSSWSSSNVWDLRPIAVSGLLPMAVVAPHWPRRATERHQQLRSAFANHRLICLNKYEALAITGDIQTRIP
jgi:hypothetical protein